MLVKLDTSGNVLDCFNDEGFIVGPWESELNWKTREKCPDHIAGYRVNIKKSAHIIESSQNVYEIIVRK